MPPPTDTLPTEDVVFMPWAVPSVSASPPVLHVCIAWLLDAPERSGEVARIDLGGWLGRSSGEDPEERRVVFERQRPGTSEATPPIVTPALSRRQLHFTPLRSDGVRVRNEGKRPLLHNGTPVTECELVAGETLEIEDLALLLVVARPVSLPPLRHYPAIDFPFGAPDAHGIVGESPAAWALRDELAAAAALDGHVLLAGPTGAGKEVAARAIHALSRRAAGPFVSRNAATIPATLIDAELFGTARDYPNRGTPERKGLIGEAHRGHLMLDEIGELPATEQTHLLRVLDANGEHQRLRLRRSTVLSVGPGYIIAPYPIQPEQ